MVWMVCDHSHLTLAKAKGIFCASESDEKLKPEKREGEEIEDCE
jgi:hypothetical protein